MILQIHARLGFVQKYGCKFFCHLFHVSQHTQRMFDLDEIERAYRDLVARGLMSEKCFIKGRDDGAVMTALGLRAEGSRTVDPGYVCLANEVEIQCWERPRPETGGVWRHFVCPGYDPYGQSRTVREGELVSKRILKLLAVSPVGEA